MGNTSPAIVKIIVLIIPAFFPFLGLAGLDYIISFSMLFVYYIIVLFYIFKNPKWLWDVEYFSRVTWWGKDFLTKPILNKKYLNNVRNLSLIGIVFSILCLIYLITSSLNLDTANMLLGVILPLSLIFYGIARYHRLKTLKEKFLRHVFWFIAIISIIFFIVIVYLFLKIM